MRAYGRAYREHLAFLQDFQWWSTARQQAYQDEQLRSLVAHAYVTVPHYRAVMDERCLRPGDIATVADLARLPLVVKAQFRDRPGEFRSSAFSDRMVHPKVTSGTTGAATCVLWSWDAYEKEYAHWRLRDVRAGVGPGDLRATIAGHVVINPSQSRPPYHRWNWAERQVFFSGYHLQPDTAPDYARALARMAPAAISGYTSHVFLLATAAIRAGVRVRPKAVLCGSETILDWHVEAVREAFDAPLLGFYGMTELTGCASQCLEGTWHCHLAHSIHEVLDENGAPCPPGKPGRLVATSLLNYAMPLIRHDTRDIVVPSDRPCPCGRPGPTWESIEGRSHDYVVTRDGRFISSNAASCAFARTPDILEAQIVQEEAGAVTVRVVPKPGYGPTSEARARELLAERLGSDTHVEWAVVDHIPREPSGKFRFVKTSIGTEHAIAEAMARRASDTG
jgi:phenylacetate-CoA ligase